MNQTNGGSKKEEPCVVCMSVGRGNKELEMEAAGEKDSPVGEGMYINVQEARIYENDTMRTSEGMIINLEKGAYNKIQATRKERRKYNKKSDRKAIREEQQETR